MVLRPFEIKPKKSKSLVHSKNRDRDFYFTAKTKLSGDRGPNCARPAASEAKSAEMNQNQR